MSDHPDEVIDLLRQAEKEGLLDLCPPDRATRSPEVPEWMQSVLTHFSGFQDDWIDVDFRRPAVWGKTGGKTSPFREIGSPGFRGAAWLVQVTASGDWCGIWYRSDDVYLFVARSLSKWLRLLIANRRYVKTASHIQDASDECLLEDHLDRTAAEIPRDNSHLPTVSQWIESAIDVPPFSLTGKVWRIADFRWDASARGFCVRGRRPVVALEAHVLAVPGPRVPHAMRVLAAPFLWCAKVVAAIIFLWSFLLALLCVAAVIIWLVRLLAGIFVGR